MRPSDRLHRFLIDSTNVRGELVHLDGALATLLSRGDYPPALAQLLGEAMAATALLAATVKYQGTLTLQVSGPGPVTLLVIQADPSGGLRGLAQRNGEVPTGTPREQFGSAAMALTIDPGAGMQDYQGVVPLDGPDLAGCIEGYFAQSEQLPTRLWLAAAETRAAGLLLQRLPGSATDEDGWERLTRLAATLTGPELLGLPVEELLRRLYHEERVRMLGEQHIEFRCRCSRQRSAAMLRQLGEADVRALIAREGEVEVTCGFCNAVYRFDPFAAEEALAGVQAAAGKATRH